MPAAQFALTGLMLPGIMLIPSIGGSPRIFAQLKTAAREDALVTAFLRLLRRLSRASHCSCLIALARRRSSKRGGRSLSFTLLC